MGPVLTVTCFRLPTGLPPQGGERKRARRPRRVAPLACVSPSTPLTQALGLLLEAGVSSLPVVDASGALVDIYARADITTLAKVGWAAEGGVALRGFFCLLRALRKHPPQAHPGLASRHPSQLCSTFHPSQQSNAYTRLQFEDVTVGQALSLAGQPLAPPQLGGSSAALAGAGGPSGAPPQWGSSPRGSAASLGSEAGVAAAAKQHRLHICTPSDALRTVVERLSVPGVRRLIVVDALDTRRVEGIVSLSDVAAYLLM